MQERGTTDEAAQPPGGARAADPSDTPALRELVGEVLRDRRRERGDRLVDVAERAGISPQYLSEIERGRKDPSSEMVEAVAGAVGLDLDGLLLELVRRRGLGVVDDTPPAVAEPPTLLQVVPRGPSGVGRGDLGARCLAA